MNRLDPHARWVPHKDFAAHLVAFDIVGFSKLVDDAVALLSVRKGLIRAVEETAFFQESASAGIVWAHFLGDELRLAFLADNAAAHEVRTFAEDVILNLEDSQQQVSQRRAAVVAVALSGYLSAKTWRGCRYLHGELAYKIQRWMDAKAINRGELAVDSAFFSSSGGMSNGWRRVEFDSDVGWVRTVIPEEPSA